jgi:FtsP/CotA-like multicopper oxidase with cupredoxin domain
VLPVGYFWWTSLVPSTYSVMDMGYVDLGGGPGSVDGHGAHDGHVAATGTSVADLTGPQDGTPDVEVSLTARKQTFRLASGEEVDGYTLDGRSPGPTIRATVGDLVQVTLVNKDVEGGVTLHWHGVDVPNAEDGVAGVTQDAVPAGHRYVYRFVAPHEGTYWYHSHQVSHEQVRGGLFGVLVIDPGPADDASAGAVEVLAPIHTYAGRRTVAGRTGVTRVDAPAGSAARVRVVNTDNAPVRVWLGRTPFRVLAIDGYDVTDPGRLTARTVVVAAGGRIDLGLTVPSSGARLDVGSEAAVVVGPAGPAPRAGKEPEREFDPLGYGSPAALPFEPDRADRRFEYRIGRRIGFEDGRPGFWWSINGHLWPDVPMYTVREGDVVTMTISNTSGDVHPMHLHGHHAVVLSRDGRKATGSPWWVDSLDVGNGETFVIAFVADNPGIWMDHCHNLQHAAQGLVAHLAYEGVMEPYTVGASSHDDLHNHPE